MKLTTLCVSLLAASLGAAFAADKPPADPNLQTAEAEYYRIVTLPTPDGVQLEAGALQWLGEGRLAVASRHGDIYVLANALSESPEKMKFTRFASGLHEVLGLAAKDGWLYATQRGELTRMKDTNGDGRADVFENVGDPWGINGDYHEYAFGSKFDREGSLWVALCLTGSFRSEMPYRGWAMRLTADGRWVPTTSGLRSPGGIGMHADGTMFYTDNQGPWNGACALKELRPNHFAGHPDGLVWFDKPETKEAIAATGMKKPETPKSGGRMHEEVKRIPQLIPPAVMFPYPEMGQSASGLVADMTGGKFGPFAGQMFVGDQTQSTIMRVFLEKVNGRYQGACFPFRQGFDSGTLALEFADDASMFVYGTDRGWGARGGKPFALQRLIWTGKTPFEICEMRARPDGFEFTFTDPVDPQTAANPASYTMKAYTHIYQSTYGSPKVDESVPAVTAVRVAGDGRSARLIVAGLVEGHVHEIHLAGVTSAKGAPLLHKSAYYTLNLIPAE